MCKAFDIPSMFISMEENVWTTERVAEELFLLFSIIIVSPLSQVADRVPKKKTTKKHKKKNCYESIDM